MKHTELRQFLKESNEIGLSPIEKDVFQYYYSRCANGENAWHCPDTETAAEIVRSRNGVCVARKSLVERGWVSENGQFNISILKTFSVRNQTEPAKDTENESEIRLKTSPKSDSSVRNQTENNQNESGFRLENENPSPKSDSPVRNQTQTAEIPVRNQTPLKDKINFKGIIKRNKEEKHTQDVRARENLDEFKMLTMTGIATILRVKTLPDKLEWLGSLNWAFENGFDSTKGIECFQLLHNQKWRKYPVSPKEWSKHLPALDNLRIEKQEEKTNGKQSENSPGRTNDAHLRPRGIAD